MSSSHWQDLEKVDDLDLPLSLAQFPSFKTIRADSDNKINKARNKEEGIDVLLSSSRDEDV